MRIHMSPKSSTAGHLSHSKSSRAKATAATHDLLPVPWCIELRLAVVDSRLQHRRVWNSLPREFRNCVIIGAPNRT